jgi:hypothetical protein
VEASRRKENEVSHMNIVVCGGFTEKRKSFQKSLDLRKRNSVGWKKDSEIFAPVGTWKDPFDLSEFHE